MATKRLQQHMAAAADRYQQRADELITAYHAEQRTAYPNLMLLSLLLTHADLWQRLADGARGAANGRGR